MAVTYQLQEAITAVRRESETGGVRIISLPADTLLELDAAEYPSGLINVRWDGHTVAVFMQDLKSRAQLLNGRRVTIRP